MPSAKAIRDILIARIAGYSPRDATRGLQESLNRAEHYHQGQSSMLDELAAKLSVVDNRLAELERAESATAELVQLQLAHVRSQRDSTDALRERLALTRASESYEVALSDPEPLVTVRIPSHRKTEELIELAIASVRAQSYERYEIVVVNDGPNPRTSSAIQKLGDPRIRYFELPEQHPYPTDRHRRWMVAGSPGMNLGADVARGSWIAPLDDDDEFSTDHIETLLALAHRSGSELAYGAVLQKHLTNGTESVIFSDPPQINEFSFLGALYLADLRFFRWDTESWIVSEPGDWNLMRKMKLAGVRMAATSHIVGTMYSISYTEKS